MTGISAAAGTAAMLETPGVTVNAIPASASASASSPPRPKTNGSPPLSRTTSSPAAPVLDEQRVDLRLLERRARDDERVLGRLRDELRRDERVVDEHVAGANELEPAGRDQPGVARAGADEVDGHESARSTRRSKYALRSS